MTVALRSSGTRATTTPGVPAGVQNDDVVAVWVTGNTFSADRFPEISGFTSAGIVYSGAPATTGRYLACLVRKQQAGDPTSGTYTITVTGGNVAAAQAHALSGVDLTAPLYGVVVSAVDTALATPSPAISASGLTVGSYLMYSGATAGGTVTASGLPSDWTEVSTTSASQLHTITRLAAGTSVSAVSYTQSAASTGRTALLVEFPEATGGGGSGPTEDVIVGGVKKAVTAHSVIIGGAKKTVTAVSVIIGGVKKPLV